MLGFDGLPEALMKRVAKWKWWLLFIGSRRVVEPAWVAECANRRRNEVERGREM